MLLPATFSRINGINVIMPHFKTVASGLGKKDQSVSTVPEMPRDHNRLLSLSLMNELLSRLTWNITLMVIAPLIDYNGLMTSIQ